MTGYANITLHGPARDDVVVALKAIGAVAYVSNTVRDSTVVFHEDLAGQEHLAAELSQRLACAALVVMTYGQRVLLYQLYESGQLTDQYVSEHVEELLGASNPPAGDAERLCDAFGRPSAARRVTTILGKVAKDAQPYAYAANRHGELCQALGLPQFAVQASYAAIEHGELPAGPGFEAGALVPTG